MPLYTPGRRRAIILLLLTSVLLLTLDLRGNAVFDTARSGFATIARAVRDGRRRRHPPDPQRLARDHRLRRLLEENERLRDQIDAQRGDQVAAQAAIQDYAGAARRSTTCRRSATTRRSPATVVGESPSNLDQVIEINKGSDDGIDVGMAVVVGAGLVGKITAPVLPDRSNVMLLTDTRYATGGQGRAGAPPETTTTTAPRRRRAPPPDATVTDRRRPRRHDDATADSTVPPTTHRRRPRRRPTTTTIDVDQQPRHRPAQRPRRRSSLPQVDLLDDTPVFGRIVEGDIVLTAGGTDGLAPPDIPVGIVQQRRQPVVGRGTAAGGRAARRPRPAALRARRPLQAGGRGRRRRSSTQAGG